MLGQDNKNIMDNYNIFRYYNKNNGFDDLKNASTIGKQRAKTFFLFNMRYYNEDFMDLCHIKNNKYGLN